jgi:hypothetical protein
MTAEIWRQIEVDDQAADWPSVHGGLIGDRGRIFPRPDQADAKAARHTPLLTANAAWSAAQGERRETPSLMNTRSGVVPEALPSTARHLPSVQRMPPCAGTASNSTML